MRLTAVPAGAAVVPVVTTDRLRNSEGETYKPHREDDRQCEAGVMTLTFGRGQQPHLRLCSMKQQVVSLGQLVWPSHMFLAGGFGRETAQLGSFFSQGRSHVRAAALHL